MDLIKANGAAIPVLGLGTWQLNGSVGSRVTEQALRLGYRHLDCALIYGNEKEVGEGLHASGVKREEVFITTKVPHTELAPPALERAVKQSLKNLRISDVNLLLIHWPNPHIPLAETLGAMAKMKRDSSFVFDRSIASISFCADFSPIRSSCATSSAFSS